MKAYINLFFVLAMMAIIILGFLPVHVFYIGMLVGAIIMCAFMVIAYDLMVIEGPEVKRWANGVALKWVCRAHRTREWTRTKILRFFLWGIRKVQKKPPAIQVPRIVPVLEAPEKEPHYIYNSGYLSTMSAQFWRS